MYNPEIMDLFQKVASFIELHGLLSPGQLVVLGVSGGPDSLCLWGVLQRLGYPLIIAHLDHQLRPESSQEVRYVRELAETDGLKFESESADVKSMAEKGMSLEEAARALRYQFLIRIAEKYASGAIATGHTADDQVETVLMHFLRGAGPDGLSGMSPRVSISDWVGMSSRSSIQLIRPLLTIARSETVEYCKTNNLEPLIDPTNEDPSFFRNKIRSQLIPALEVYNPQIREVVLRTAEVMSGLSSHIMEERDRVWSSVILQESKTASIIEVPRLMDQSVALQRSILRTLIRGLTPSVRDIPFQSVERLRHGCMDMEAPKRMQTIGGLELLRFGTKAVLRIPDTPIPFREFPQREFKNPRQIEVPEEIKLQGGWVILVTREKLNQDLFKEITHAERGMLYAVAPNQLRAPLSLRNLSSGDRITPLGMTGRSKVSEIFVNEKVPWPAREHWPLLVHEEEIIWIPGLRVSENYKMDPDDEEILLFRLKHNDMLDKPSREG